MAGYEALKITGMETGLVQEREEFLLPNDAYPTLENAYVWRERIKRKQGYALLGRLRRVLTAQVLGNTVGAVTTYTFANIFASFVPAVGASETNKSIQKGSLVITIGAPDTATFTDNGLGGFTVTGAGVALGSSVNYVTGAVTIVLSASAGGSAITAAINYYPNLPVMGLPSRELNQINNEELVAFDQIYAYRIGGTGFEEFLPGTTWTGIDSQFFWSTNYWIGDGDRKIFWVTNFADNSPAPTDPIRYTNGVSGTNWINFAPIINVAGDRLQQCQAILPFRGRLVAFNTFEGAALAGSIQQRQRIRWAAIGNPFTEVSAIVSVVSADAWRDDIRGKGGFLDIPTSENIISVGFVRDNLVIYCERSTWQLRYTGRSISPFQIEKVNSELGAESTFSLIQFDTSLVGVGDKGIVECDSFKSERIDIKIPDLVYEFRNINSGPERVHGIRDFQKRLAYWTYPYNPTGAIFPNRRLVYNYENDSWAIFTDSLTTFGTYQAQTGYTWNNSGDFKTWEDSNFAWISAPANFPSIIGGNQQGYVEYLDVGATNDVSLFIKGISGLDPNPTRLTVINHNLENDNVISIQDIPVGTGYATSLNDQIFGVVVIDADTLDLYKYNSVDGEFTIPQVDASATYIGGGQIRVRDGFSIVSKKFSFIDEGQNIQMGYIDILMDNTEEGAVSLNVYLDYNDSQPVNVLQENTESDTFFNSVVPTTQSFGLQGSKYWHRAYCSVRGSFITIEWTLSNAQLIGSEQESDVQIDAQILYVRRAGKQLAIIE